MYHRPPRGPGGGGSGIIREGAQLRWHAACWARRGTLRARGDWLNSSMASRPRRGHGGKRLYDLVERMRQQIDGLVFRTAFIVGHPGESEDEFNDLVKFVEWAQFDRVGVFRYSDEEEAHAFSLDHKVDKTTSYNRARKLMAIQRKISKKLNKKFVGQEIDVLVEGASEESELVMVGRHFGQSPDIDGQVYLSGAMAQPGRAHRR